MDRIETSPVTDSTPARVYKVDAEHSRLRLVVVAVFVTSGFISYFAINAIAPGVGLNLIAVIGSFAIAYGITAILEQALKRRWPSGRSIEVDAQGVRLMQHGRVQQQVNADQSANTLLWHFQTKRRSRVPKGWYLLACALEQGDASVSVYTLMSPDQFKKIDNNDRFKLLKAKSDTTTTSTRGRDDLLLAGEQRRLLHAENQRWQTGAEMTVDDFTAYVETVTPMFARGADEV